MGSPENFAGMLDLVATHKIEPVIDEVLPLSEGNAALQRMRDSKQFGKIVLEM